ncbi:hypothetical protein M404DRAFT_740204 [Pisolithus tinctorius Marx 270]|uniref:Uncharacterized protein n=1 Tax=Pisolithus tinctorius Marx 270 TaxID=870435 RepID=A0A0C3P108_PISTI|nr:hypothetical protein M404DRAFT_740204 [Pisolithus tinctorius Marx 270]
MQRAQTHVKSRLWVNTLHLDHPNVNIPTTCHCMVLLLSSFDPGALCTDDNFKTFAVPRSPRAQPLTLTENYSPSFQWINIPTIMTPHKTPPFLLPQRRSR